MRSPEARRIWNYGLGGMAGKGRSRHRRGWYSQDRKRPLRAASFEARPPSVSHPWGREPRAHIESEPYASSSARPSPALPQPPPPARPAPPATATPDTRPAPARRPAAHPRHPARSATPHRPPRSGAADGARKSTMKRPTTTCLRDCTPSRPARADAATGQPRSQWARAACRGPAPRAAASAFPPSVKARVVAVRRDLNGRSPKGDEE